MCPDLQSAGARSELENWQKHQLDERFPELQTQIAQEQEKLEAMHKDIVHLQENFTKEEF